MKTFKAKVISPDGAQIVILAAETESLAIEAAERLGKVIYCHPHFDLMSIKKLTSEEREQFLNQLSFLLSSGVGTGQSLRTLQSTYSGRLEALSGELLTQIENGESLSSALATVGARDFSPALLALVAAGHSSGKSAESLKAAAEFEADMRSLTSSTGGELFAAFSGFFTAVICTLFSVFYMGPKVLSSELTTAAGDGVDVAWAMTSGKILGVILVAITVGLALLYLNHTVLRKITPELSDKVSQAIPLWRELAFSKERFLAFFSLKSLTGPGLSLEEAFKLTAKGTVPGTFQKELKNAANAIKSGESWVSALKSLPHIDQAALNVAGDRKHMADIFGKLSIQYRHTYTKARQTTATILKLTAAFCLALSGGLLFAVSILPMLQATKSLL